jgi:nucleoside 2-deoxyribosyltransferase
MNDSHKHLAGVSAIKKVYISGPITGLPALNKPAFDAAADTLRAQGLQAVNPHDNGVPPAEAWDKHMRADIKLLMDCDAVVLLQGWENSRGARIEMRLADSLGMPIADLEQVAAGQGWRPTDMAVN